MHTHCCASHEETLPPSANPNANPHQPPHSPQQKVEEFPSWRHHVESALALRRRALAAALERQLADAYASGGEIRWGR